MGFSGIELGILLSAEGSSEGFCICEFGLEELPSDEICVSEGFVSEVSGACDPIKSFGKEISAGELECSVVVSSA